MENANCENCMTHMVTLAAKVEENERQFQKIKELRRRLRQGRIKLREVLELLEQQDVIIDFLLEN